MSVSGWISLLLILGALYALVLIGYRLVLSSKQLLGEIQVLRSKTESLKQVEELPFVTAHFNRADELGELLAKREQYRRAKRHRAEDRRRKLIQHVQDLDLDKR